MNYSSSVADLLIIAIIVLFLILLYLGQHIYMFVLLGIVLALEGYLGRRPSIPPLKFPDNVITSPCYGEVIEVNKGDSLYEIIVYLRLTDIHYQYSPCRGVINKIIHKPGTYAPAYLTKKTDANERVETYILNKHGMIGVYQIAGMIADRISTYVRPGDSVDHETVISYIYLGSQVRVYLPVGKVDLLCRQGDKVYGPETVIATWL